MKKLIRNSGSLFLIILISILFFELFFFILEPFLVFNRAKEPEKSEIVLFAGDSFCYGSGVKPEHSYPSIFSDMTGNVIQSINKGKPGSNTRYITENLEKWIYTYKPERVVIQSGIDNYFNLSGLENASIIKKSRIYRFFKTLSYFRNRNDEKYVDIWDVLYEDKVQFLKLDLNVNYKKDYFCFTDNLKPGSLISEIFKKIDHGNLTQAKEIIEQNFTKMSSEEKNKIMATIYTYSYEKDKALEIIRDGLEKWDGDLYWIMLYADLLEMEGENQESLKWIKMAMEMLHDSPSVQEYAISLYLFSDKIEEAYVIFNKFEKSNSDREYNLFYKAVFDLLNGGNPDYQDIQDIFIRSEFCLFAAEFFHDRGEYDKAEIYYEKGIEMNENNWNIYLSYALFLKEINPDKKDYISYLFEKAIKSGNSFYIKALYCDYLIENSDFEISSTYLEELFYEYPEKRLNILLKEHDNGFFNKRYDISIKALEKMYEIFKDNPEKSDFILSEKAKYHKLMQDYEKAAAIYGSIGKKDEADKVLRILSHNSNKNIYDWLYRDYKYIIEICQKKGVELFFMNYVEEDIKAMRDICKRYNITLIDIFGLEKRKNLKENIFQKDGHLNAYGNRSVAKEIYENLEGFNENNY